MSLLARFKRIIESVKYRKCANENCEYDVLRLGGEIGVCSNECYDAMRDRPGAERKLVIASR